MFIKIRKSNAIYFKTNDTPKGRLVNLSSHLYLNLHQITELSHYTLKSPLEKQSVDGKPLTLPAETKVVHLMLAPTFASYPDSKDSERRIHERRFYTLHYLPESLDEYLAIRQALNGFILNND
ncbi:hypothetical protein [Marinospirillum alkaliphilum]|uniref:Uncharacterized protein n=1 Tax=Marinospirillum alkaliphilum DSM 21637 TaxID=1122209 RepID=A0A1K1ZF23_9GAMM|nr:hypothetical protein [Marinospirillum alkaliphilum]SFX72777.1 hypothetical protein SAMN02745752_02660 [Marinospirillum alkaliphilum DSM 21637]